MAVIMNDLLCFVQTMFVKRSQTLVGVAINMFSTDKEYLSLVQQCSFEPITSVLCVVRLLIDVC